MEEENLVVDLTEIFEFIDLTEVCDECVVPRNVYRYGGAVCRDLTDWEKQNMKKMQDKMNERFSAFVEMKRRKRLVQLQTACSVGSCVVIQYKFGIGYVVTQNGANG